jgi:hypothetical protein
LQGGDRQPKPNLPRDQSRSGAITFGDLVGRLDVLRVAGRKCERVARSDPGLCLRWFVELQDFGNRPDKQDQIKPEGPSASVITVASSVAVATSGSPNASQTRSSLQIPLSAGTTMSYPIGTNLLGPNKAHISS